MFARFHIRFPNRARHSWPLTLIAGLTMVSFAAAQTERRHDSVAEVARAEQLYDLGNYLEAARILRRVVDDSGSGTSGETIAALRLLAQVYYRSADYAQAAKAGERTARLTAEPDAEMALLLADSFLALRRYDEAALYLRKFHAASRDTTSGELQEARLALDAERIAAALRRANQQTVAKPSAPPGPTAAIEIVPDKYQAAQRFQAVNFAVDRYLESDRLDDAMALVAKEISSRAYDDVELAELNLKLADCYKRQAARHAEAGDASAHRAAINNRREVLNRLLTELNRRRSRPTKGTTDQAENLATLFAQEATVHELQAELASESQLANRRAMADQLTRAANRYRQLLKIAGGQGLSPGRASHFRDTALCGLQRVYDAMRLATPGQARERIIAELRAVSDALVSERSSRLLPTDPALYNARLAQASIYASIDDRASHQRAADIYRELIADRQPGADPHAHATALVGLAEVLRGLNETRDAYGRAYEAKRLIDEATVDDGADSRREHALLAARIDNSLGVSCIALGQYQDALKYIVAADRRLKPYGETVAGVSDPGYSELRRKNEDTLHVLSRVKVYRGLLHKAEAQYDDAARRVREGRELREQLDEDADLLAYYLAEASVHLAQAHARMQETRAPADEPAVRAALTSAEAALDKARPLREVAGDKNEPRQMAAALPYRYLRALLARLNGDRDTSRQAFAALAEDSQRYGDGKTAAKCFIQLAQLSAEAAAQSPSAGPAPSADTVSAELRRADVEALRDFKLDRRQAILEAADYAAKAVTLFQQLDRGSKDEDEEAVTALPSLHFQAAFLAGRLHVLVAALDSHIRRLNELLETASTSSAESQSDHRKLAIDFLEDAVKQAERPASSTTQVRLQRAKFFARYAPAYDLLVDLHVAAAVGDADRLAAEPNSEAFGHLRRAVEVADLARNRTFREQIDGWRESAGRGRDSQAFDWEAEVAQLAGPGSILLVYHLDGPQLLHTGTGQLGSDVARIGGGHLFAISDEGRIIQYFRLQHKVPGDGQPGDLTRELAADLVRRHVAWIEEPQSAADWGRAEQRELTEALLPRELLASLVNAGGRDSSAALRHLLIIPDGALHQLPFESLLLPQAVVESDSIRYVLDELPPIRYGPSLSVLAAISKTSGQGGETTHRLLTVGNPAYPDRGRQTEIPAWGELFRQIPDYEAGFPALTHSAEECESVYASFSGAAHANRVLLLQDSATEAAVRQHMPGSHFIHLAAHGCVDYQNDNLFGALVFTPSGDQSDPQNDGLLQLRDIYALDLSRCELAVLSACQTYVGPERPLEAGTSMARAFLERGAKRVVCSQWSTDDQATTYFMKVFFDSIRRSRQAGEEVDYARALHEAKRALRDDESGRGSLPKYWAPFVLVGAP